MRVWEGPDVTEGVIRQEVCLSVEDGLERGEAVVRGVRRVDLHGGFSISNLFCMWTLNILCWGIFYK